MHKEIDTNTSEAIKLDMKDRKILFELDMNARQPISQIAKKVRLSKETVNYRIKQLEKRGIIEGYYAVIDAMNMGYTFYRIMLRFQNVDSKKEQEILDYVKKLPNVAWLASLEGNWDMVLVIWSKDVSDFKEIYDKLVYKYSNYILHKYETIATKIYHFKKNFLYGTKDSDEMIVGEKSKKIKIDSIDYIILNMLSKDARMPIIDISKKVKLTPNAVKQRINHLIKNNIILGFRAKINLSKFDYQHYKVFLYLQNMTGKTKEELIHYLKSNMNVAYITEAIGDADLEFEIFMKNSTEIHNLLKEMRNQFSVIKNYEVVLTYYEHQINYLPSL
jgi:Lrp/AsnC family leucine-responsive transcriptional regulator